MYLRFCNFSCVLIFPRSFLKSHALVSTFHHAVRHSHKRRVQFVAECTAIAYHNELFSLVTCRAIYTPHSLYSAVAPCFFRPNALSHSDINLSATMISHEIWHFPFPYTAQCPLLLHMYSFIYPLLQCDDVLLADLFWLGCCCNYSSPISLSFASCSSLPSLEQFIFFWMRWLFRAKYLIAASLLMLFFLVYHRPEIEKVLVVRCHRLDLEGRGRWVDITPE